MFNFKPNFIPNSIVLIGAGGTGSRLLPPLAQLVRSMLNKFSPNSWIIDLPIFIYDADVVEEKNLLRQNFISSDVGKPKAQVLANRYSNALSIPIYSSVNFFNMNSISRGNDCFSQGFQEFQGLSRPVFSNSIVILAVDNNEARREIVSALMCSDMGARTESGLNLFIIDAGNEDAFGQVRFFTNFILTGSASADTIQSMPSLLPVQREVGFIPIDLEYYANLGTSAAELSCVDLPQTLAINNMMAALICSTVQNFLMLKPVNYDCIRYALDGSVMTEFNTIKRWAPRAEFGRNFDLGVGDGFVNPFKGNSGKYNRWHLYCPKTSFTKLLKDYRQDLIIQFEKMGMILTPLGEVIPKPTPVKVEKVSENKSGSKPIKPEVLGSNTTEIVPELRRGTGISGSLSNERVVPIDLPVLPVVLAEDSPREEPEIARRIASTRSARRGPTITMTGDTSPPEVYEVNTDREIDR